MQWSQMEAALEADVALLRSQLNAMPIWDPDLQVRLRQPVKLRSCKQRWNHTHTHTHTHTDIYIYIVGLRKTGDAAGHKIGTWKRYV